MGVRFTTYCRRSLAHVEPEQLLHALESGDLHTLAEGYDLEDDVIEPALEQLRIEKVDATGFRRWRLCYRPAGHRQVDIDRQTTEVQEAIAEEMQALEDEDHLKMAQIIAHLWQTTDTVDASFGTMESERMALVLASEVARWFAQEFDGIVKDCNGKWWRWNEDGQYRTF